jgi:hypothetical protein
MINFKDRQDMLPSLITVSAIVVLAGTLGFILYANSHPLTSAPAVAQAKRDLRTTEAKIQEAKTTLATNQATIDASSWTGAPQEIQTQILNRIGVLAAKRNVKINTVRPQRTMDVDQLSTLPYLITVEGTYPNVLAFERDVEAPTNRLAVNVIQVTATDASTDRVTASIGVVAYLNPKGKPVITTKENNTRA